MKYGIVALILAVACTISPAQTRPAETLVSPETHPDRTVTFRMRAPKAAEVTLTGDWMAANSDEKLTKDDKGVWSITTGPLEAGIAIYNFNVDGLAMADLVNPRMKLRARTSASLVDVPGDGNELFASRDVPRGLVEINYHTSKALDGQQREFRVYTPPGYHQNSTEKYPVLYLFHGNNDTAAGWTEVGRANAILDNLIADKKARPMIIVMPWGHAVPFGQPNNNPTFERYMLDAVIPLVEKTYRVAPGRENRAIVGLSMGGGQALSIGLGHLDLFSVVGSFSGAIPQNPETQFKAILDDPTGTNTKLKLLWIGCGRQDSLFARSQQFSELLNSKQIKNTFYPIDGRHNYTAWRKFLIEVAPQLFR